uniref:Fibrinogen C-terminal domain-containing protein n=1 Tax=Amphimedon queenslandica TaxID=400682 RepID=A0A1X7TQE6_AMPQE
MKRLKRMETMDPLIDNLSGFYTFKGNMAFSWSGHLLLACLIFVIIVTAKSCFPRDCKEAFNQGNTCSGVYTIKPDELPAFKVYCDE